MSVKHLWADLQPSTSGVAGDVISIYFTDNNGPHGTVGVSIEDLECASFNMDPNDDVCRLVEFRPSDFIEWHRQCVLPVLRAARAHLKKYGS